VGIDRFDFCATLKGEATKAIEKFHDQGIPEQI